MLYEEMLTHAPANLSKYVFFCSFHSVGRIVAANVCQRVPFARLVVLSCSSRAVRYCKLTNCIASNPQYAIATKSKHLHVLCKGIQTHHVHAITPFDQRKFNALLPSNSWYLTLGVFRMKSPFFGVHPHVFLLVYSRCFKATINYT